MTTIACGNGITLRGPNHGDAASISKHANDRNVWINLRDRMPYPGAYRSGLVAGNGAMRTVGLASAARKPV